MIMANNVKPDVTITSVQKFYITLPEKSELDKFLQRVRDSYGRI